MNELMGNGNAFKNWSCGLFPPFLQLWPNRERLTGLAMENLESRPRERVNYLVAQITKSAKLEYQEAEQLFSAGQATEEHLAKLL